MSKIIIQLTILILLTGCGNNQQKSSSNDWVGTSWRQLDQEDIKLRIPQDFKKSSRYRIKEDIPIIAKDSIRLRLLQNILEKIELQDEEVDVFVDTTKTFRMLIICNIERINFKKSDVAVLKQQLKATNKAEAQKHPTLKYGEVTAKYKANSNHQLARLSTQLLDSADNSVLVNNSIYYLSGDAYTLIVYEFSEDEESIEKYLWTTKM